MVRPKKTATPTVPAPTGAREKVDPPETAATITVAEAGEIRERKRLMERLGEKVKAKQDELNDLVKIAQLMRIEHQQYLTSICRSYGLDLNDDYNVESESGVIWRTSRPAKVAAIEETAPVEAAPVAATNGS